MEQKLRDKRAIVTAGASGIGRVIAERLRAAGARVAVCDIEEAALRAVKDAWPDVIAVRCDVSDPEAVETAMDEMLARLGGVDILVNNAGSAGPTACVEDIDVTEWDQAIRVNLNSQFLFTRGVVPAMKRQESGVIFNMSSAAGRLGMPMRSPYVAAKWAVIGLTQTLAMELGPSNIRVNAILPGSVRGDRMTRVMQAKAEATGQSVRDIEAEETAAMSLGRMIEPDEIADLVVYVASDSGRSISGQSLGVCGNTEILR
ncbi:3-ketoacyl-ACP reductase [Roseovarius indicus]|uniref:3-ketoacyl-ACP reductase n=1 Tax=Roseovarius indicus TaxID=540747 RepID=A0A0T5P3S3_9RHOB|nr:3-ketoacyl-ACP reductase [Roseovarius indicus]